MFNESCFTVFVTLITSDGCSSECSRISISVVVILLVIRLSEFHDLSNVDRPNMLRERRGLGSLLPKETPGEASFGENRYLLPDSRRDGQKRPQNGRRAGRAVMIYMLH